MAGTNIIEKPALEKLPTATSTAEKLKSPEKRAEQVVASPDQAAEKRQSRLAASQTAAQLAAQAVPDWQKQRAAAIDEILSSGLNEVFLQMNTAQQQEFKQRGEETVTKINGLLSQTKVKITKIIDLIKNWLKLIPGINKFFLEQEAKIKADKIMKIKDKF
jgi:hypothetical protein